MEQNISKNITKPSLKLIYIKKKNISNEKQ